MTLGRNRSDASRPWGPLRGGRRTAGLGARRAGRLAATVAATSVAVTTALSLSGAAPSGASVASEQAKANQLAQQIVADGAAVQQAVAQENAAQAKSAELAAEVAATKARLATYRRAQARAQGVLRRLVVRAYMTDQGAAGASSVFDGGSANSLVAQAEYSHVADGGLQVAIAAYQTDEEQTHAAAVSLEAQQGQAAAAASQLASAGQQAQAALTQDTVLLGQVKNDIAVLQAAAAVEAQKAAAQEAALAAQQAQRQSVATPAVAQAAAPVPAPQVQVVAAAGASPAAPATAPAGYANPLRSISGLTPERIDQGVDYSGYGPLYAIGSGVVLNTVNAGWPGGTFITYRLTAGPGAGLVVFAAEDIQPAVQVGQQVTSTTVIGTMYEGPDGIETGWADPAGNGYTMAHDSGQFGGSNSTAFGANFSQLLVAIGAPGGVLQNNPPAGTLPSNWPAW